MKAILVVDDDPDIRLVCRGRLEHLGYVVHCAASGEHALAVLSTHDIHAMVLDLHLPGLEGAEVIRLIREQGLTLPILLISASHSGQPNKLLGSNGAQGFLPKPFANEELDHWVIHGWDCRRGRTWHGNLHLLHHQVRAAGFGH